MSFAADMGAALAKEAAVSPGALFRGLGQRLKPALGPGALGQTAVGAGLGAAKAGIEQGTGVLDPNISPEGRWAHLGLNMAGGAALGNPAARNAMFFKKTTLNVPGQPGATVSQSNFRPLAAMGAGTAYMGLPYTTNLTDATRKFARGAQTAVQSDGFQRAIQDPAAYGKEVASNAATNAARELGTSPAGREGAHAFMGSMGNNIAGGIGGSLVGGALGGIAGHMFAGDDPSLDYEARRRRERWRSILGLGGTVAGGIAAPMLLSKYAPNLIPNMLSKATGVAK